MHETWFQEIFDGSRDAIFLIGEDARFVEVSRAACELTGYSHTKLLSMSFRDLCDESDLQAFHNYFDSIMSGGDAVSEALIRREDGTKVPVEFNSRRMLSRGKAIMHIVARDISGRKWVKERLQERKTTFYCAADSALGQLGMGCRSKQD